MTKKKLILFPFLGNSVGGSHLSTLTLIKNIKIINYEYIVLLINTGVLENVLIENKIKYIKINLNIPRSFNNIINIIKVFIFNFFKVYKILKKLNPYAVHTNELKMHYLWSMICKVTNIPHIWHQHSAFYSRRNIFFSALSTKILTVSNFCKNSFTKEMSKRAQIVYNPFDINMYKKNKVKKANLLKKINLIPNKNTISFFGGESSQKGFHKFLEIIKKLDLKYRNRFNYLIVGNIKEKRKIVNLNLKGKTKIISFNNFINDLIKISDIIIFPSKNEGFGRVLIEAMLLKTYFIVSNSGAHKELVINNQNGFISYTNIAQDYVDIALKILKNKNKNKNKNIINNAFKFAESKFSVQKYILRIKKHYDELKITN